MRRRETIIFSNNIKIISSLYIFTISFGVSTASVRKFQLKLSWKLQLKPSRGGGGVYYDANSFLMIELSHVEKRNSWVLPVILFKTSRN